MFKDFGLPEIMVIVLLLVPGIIAGYRRHRHTYLVGILGLTAMGWIPALVWALIGDVKPLVTFCTRCGTKQLQANN